MKTSIRVINAAAADMGGIASESVDLIVTSPPYPMIEMWDAIFTEQDRRIGRSLEAGRLMPITLRWITWTLLPG